METPTTESVERALVAPESTFDEPPIEIDQQPGQTAPETQSPEGQQPDSGPQPGEGTEERDPSSPEPQPEDEAIGYDDLLPATQLKRGQKYPDELLSLAAKRWGYEPDALEDPRYGQNLRSLLTDKINADIKIRDDQREREVREREQAAAPPKEEKPPEQEQQPAAQPQTFEAISGMASQVAEQIVTDEGATHFGPRLYDALAGIATLRENEDASPQDVLKANRALTQVMSEFGVMLLAQTTPQVVDTILRDKNTQEKIFSPFIESVLERREGTVDQETKVYDDARELLVKEPGFSDIDKLSGKGGPLDQLAETYFEQTGTDIFQIQFVDKETRQPLPPVQNAMQQLRHAVTLMRGRDYKPQDRIVQDAMEKGKRDAERSARRSELGSSLKTGRPSGRLVPQTTSAQEEMDDLINASDRANPLSLEASSNRTR